MGKQIPECYDINSTCGVNIDVLKQLVREYFASLPPHQRVDHNSFLQIIPTDCTKIFSDIKFAGADIANCSDIFKVQTTEIGTCFTANGLYF